MAFDYVLFILDILSTFSIMSIITLSLNLEWGFTGIPNFGQVLSVASGAYVAAILAGRLPQWILGVGTRLDFIRDNALLVSLINSNLQHNIAASALTVLISIGAAMLVGGIVGYISTFAVIRLKEDYLSITLLALGELQLVVGQSYYPIARATIGVAIPDPLAAFGDKRFEVIVLPLVLILVLVFMYINSVSKSPLGRTLRAIRDNELAAEALGKDTVGFRRKIMVTGSALAALGGSLYAFYTSSVVPATFTRTAWTVIPWLAMVIGGMGSSGGSVVGAFVVVFSQRALLLFAPYLTFLPFNVAYLQYLLFGGFLIVVVLFRREGIMPERPRKFKKYQSEISHDKTKDSKESRSQRQNPSSTES